MPTLIVTATSESAGKTAITAALAAHLTSGGRSALVAQGWAGTSDQRSLRAALGEMAAEQPLGVAGDTAADLAKKIASASAGKSVTVIEGKTGSHESGKALAEAADALVLLVAKPGDDILAAARSYGSRLLGVIINAVPPYRQHEVESRIIPELKQANIKTLGWLPEDRRLLAPTLSLVAEHLGAEFVSSEVNADRLIDNFLIGGMVLDWGPFYFGSRENVGVVVRGDRPDIQLSALQSETVQAMILTKGARPVEYVVYEAAQRDIPLVLTSGSTEETATALETLLPKIRFDHPDKVVRILQLAAERLDLDAVSDALSQPATR
jgi:BioD-like phosphotransacetylase family protein